jgi:hypothetical protein
MSFTAALLLGKAVLAASSGTSQLMIQNCDVGEVYAFNSAECQIEVTNEGDTPIHLSKFLPEKDGDSIEPASASVAPKERVYLHARINTGNGLGGSPHVFRFHTDERGSENGIASAFAFVTSALDDPRPLLDFGLADSAHSEEKQWELSSHEVPNLRLTKVIEKPSWLEVRISEDGRRVVGQVRRDAFWGIHADYIKLQTNSTDQPQVWVSAKADVRGEITPSSNPFDLGLMRVGNPHEYRVVLTNRSHKAFKVGNIELKDVSGHARIESCEPAGDSCKMLVLNLTDEKAGTIQGHVWIEFPDLQQKLHLALFGLLVSKDVQVKPLDPKKLAAENLEGRSVDAPIDLQKSVKQAITKTEEVPPPGNGPLLKWTIANGSGIHGFQIFRGNTEDGEFLLLNKKSIRSTAETADPASYQYRDNTAVSGKVYWYYIGILYNDGHKQQLTGPQKVTAK